MISMTFLMMLVLLLIDFHPPIIHQDSGYHPSPTGGARKKRVQADEDGVVGVIERVGLFES